MVIHNQGLIAASVIALTLISSALSILSAESAAAAAKSTDPAAAPEPDYLAKKHDVLKWTISPNGRYGVAIIDPEIEEVPHARSFLITLKPRRVIATLPKSELPAEDKVHLKTTWSKDSQVVLVDCGHARNATDVQLLELRDDRVIRQTDLLAPIQAQFDESFRKSGAPPIHESVPFHGRGHPDEWLMDAKATRVKVRVYAESGAKDGEEPWFRWFRGVWSIPQRKWLTQELTRDPAPK